jgi:hypothetical protein
MLKLEDFDTKNVEISTDQMRSYFGGWMTTTIGANGENPHSTYYNDHRWWETTYDGPVQNADNTGNNYAIEP